MKDNFSNAAEKYANFRPSYPAPLFEYIANLCDHKVSAWDCGTGNGQVAMELCNYFQRVFATDISQNQIDNAYWDDKITYQVEAAESCSFPNKSFDLIAIAQAIHWFDFDLFYEQVRRTIKMADPQISSYWIWQQKSVNTCDLLESRRESRKTLTPR